jgi:hypothetical protein
VQAKLEALLRRHRFGTLREVATTGPLEPAVSLAQLQQAS